jgi:RimJ/RimL family protein N-acetyltransferase
MESKNILDLQPTLIGQRLLLRPMRISDQEELFEVAKDPKIWEQHPNPLRYQRFFFDKEIFLSGIQSQGALIAKLVDQEGIIGSSRFYDLNIQQKELAIGFTFLACEHWGKNINLEMKQLMLEHAFTWAECIWFHIGVGNIRSRKAIEKIGAKLSHTSPRMINQTPIEHCYYRMERKNFKDNFSGLIDPS